MIGKPFSVTIDGVHHPASYSVAGKRVKVASIYGERSAPLGEDVATAVAERLLRELVSARQKEKSSMAQHNRSGEMNAD